MLLHLIFAMIQAASVAPCDKLAGQYVRSDGYTGETLRIQADCTFSFSYSTDTLAFVEGSGSVEVKADMVVLRADTVDAMLPIHERGKVEYVHDESVAKTYKARDLLILRWEEKVGLARPPALERLCAAICKDDVFEVRAWVFLSTRDTEWPDRNDVLQWCAADQRR